jgi:hypothetical protein
MMVSNNALILTVITVFGIHYHAHFFETNKYTRLNWLLLLLLIALLAALIRLGEFAGISRLFSQYYATPSGAFTLILLWIGVTALSTGIYLRRRSYLA